jgi:uncharacterized protein YdeI (BOF family)
MKKRIILVLAALSVGLLLAACGGGTAAPPPTTPAPTTAPTPTEAPAQTPAVQAQDDANLFQDANWSMQIFGGWFVENIGGTPFLFAPDGSGSNINVVIEHMQGLSLDDYVDANIDGLELFLDNFVILGDYYMDVNGKSAIFLSFTSDLPGVHTTYQFYVESGGVNYIITYTRASENDHLDTVLDMIDTFTVR